MEYGVFGDLTPDMLDDVDGPDDLVYGIIEWSVFPETLAHGDEDEGEYVQETWYPVVMSACKDGWHAPAHTYFGPIHVFASRRNALVHASRELRRLRKQRAELERGLEGLVCADEME